MDASAVAAARVGLAGCVAASRRAAYAAHGEKSVGDVVDRAETAALEGGAAARFGRRRVRVRVAVAVAADGVGAGGGAIERGANVVLGSAEAVAGVADRSA